MNQIFRLSPNKLHKILKLLIFIKYKNIFIFSKCNTLN